MSEPEQKKTLEQHKQVRDQLEKLNRLSEQAVEIHRQAILVMTETNSVEIVCNNLRNELLEIDNGIVEKLDRG